MDFQYWLDRVINTEGANRVELARKNLNRVLEELPKFDIPEDAYGLFTVALIKLFIRADRVVSFEDYSFISEVIPMHLSAQEFMERMNDRDDEERESWLDALIDKFSEEGKEAACIFGLCVMESDDVLSREELSVFYRILN